MIPGVVPCPACERRPRPNRKAMCGPCWRVVPKPVQENLYRAWRQWSRDFGNPDHFRDYRDALDAAVIEAQR